MLPRSILPCALVLLACQAPRTDADPALSSTGTTSDDGTGSSSGIDSSSDDTGVLLDVADPDLGSNECASIEQSTMIEKLPADVIVVIDPALPDQVRYDAYATLQNLQPQLCEDDGEQAARVVLVAGPPPVCPAPPEIDLGSNPCCGEWTCWVPPWYEDAPVAWAADFFELRRDIGPDTMLTDLLALSDDWLPLLREESWKHVWLFTSRSADTTTSGAEFAAAFSSFGSSYTNFAFHVRMSEGFVDDDFVQLSRDTNGVHFPREDEGGSSYSDFVVPIQDLIRSNTLSCAYAIPDPPEGEMFDAEQVNVEYDIGVGPQTLGYVDAVDDCAAFGNGWYYDDAADPREILFCPQTCSVFKVQELASIEILFGCATIPAG